MRFCHYFHSFVPSLRRKSQFFSDQCNHAIRVFSRLTFVFYNFKRGFKRQKESVCSQHQSVRTNTTVYMVRLKIIYDDIAKITSKKIAKVKDCSAICDCFVVF